MKDTQRTHATIQAVAARTPAHAIELFAVLTLIFALCITLATPVTASAADAPLHVTVSIPPQKYFVERIGGDLVRTTVMVPPGADPHTYEPKPSQLRGLAGSRLYFSIGAPFEDAWLARIVAAAGPSLTVAPMHKGVTLLPAAAPLHIEETANAAGKEYHEERHADSDGHGHDHGHDHGTTDPHVWLSPMLVRHMSLAIRDALAKADPAHAATYRANYDRFAADIDAMDKRFADLFADLPQDKRRFLVFHPSWSYFAHNYGLTELSIEVEGREPSPRQLRAIIDLARREHITTIFVQPQFSRRAAQTIATEIGARLVDADPLAEDWATNLERTAKALTQAAGR